MSVAKAESQSYDAARFQVSRADIEELEFYEAYVAGLGS